MFYVRLLLKKRGKVINYLKGIKLKNRRREVGFFLGPALFLLILLLPVPKEMKPEAMKTAAIAVLMAVWWITEAIPIPATSLLPIVLYPVFGIMSSKEVTLPYANHLIYLFMGGFFIAVTMERWDLHKRIAINTIRFFGSSPSRLVLGFMTATAFLSMWISNTATTMMMVPIGLAIAKQARGYYTGPSDKFKFDTCLMLSIAYAASIGGVGTIIGTPPNGVLVSQIDKIFNMEISFAQWLTVGIPLVVVMITVTWLIMTKVTFSLNNISLPGGKEFIKEEIQKLGVIKKEEIIIICVGIFVSFCWISRSFLFKHIGLSLVHDSTIAILGALLLFIIPSDFKKGEFLLDWKTAVKIPWDVIILFGGGLALAEGLKESGLALWIAGNLTLISAAGLLAFIFSVIFITIFLTEITSNTATSSLLIPVLASATVAMGIHPYGPAVAACIAASYAFMLPVATPPNAVVFGSGCVTIPEMAKAGILLNIIGTILITAVIMLLLPFVWGIDLSALPEWAANAILK